MSESPFEKLENLVVDLMRQSRVPGMSIGVILDGKPVYARGFGARNREKNLPMTSDTLWRIASISKSFCAMAIMQLVEKGKVDLHAPVSKYLDFKLGKKVKPIAVHHLLSHSSGIPELDATTASSVKDMFIPMSSEKDFLTFVNKATEEVFDDPGEIFMYNNDMYTCLGFIVEKVTGMKYAEYVKENILKPLKMSRSTYLDEELEKDSNVISGYIPSKDGLTMESVPLRNDPLDYACGGLSSSVHELQNYMIALMNDGCFNGNRVLEKASIEKMWTPYIKTPKGYGETGYGYGWGIDKDFFGLTLVHHGGNIPTSGGFLAMIPEKKMGVVVGQIPNPTGIHMAIVRGLLATLLGKDMNKAVPQLEIKKKLEAIQGKYKAYGGGQVEVSMQEGILYAKLTFEGEREAMTVPLIIKDLKKLKFVIQLALADREIEVNGFVDKKTGKVHLQADRYYYHKV
jgi:CubicO group peptidase (beta-lactamase class C family)